MVNIKRNITLSVSVGKFITSNHNKVKFLDMKLLKAQNPIIWYLKSFGFFAYQVNPIANGSWKQKAFCFFVNGYLAVHFAANSTSYVDFNDFIGDGFKVTLICNMLELLINEFNIWIIIYCIACTRGKQIEFLRCLESIDEDVRNFPFLEDDMEKFYRFVKVSSWISIVSLVLFYVNLSIVYANIIFGHYAASTIFQLFCYIAFIMYYILLVAFSLNLTLAIRKLFQIMNKNLQACISRSDFYQKEIRIILKLHHKLTHSIQAFNESFGLIIFGTFLYCSAMTAIQFYYIYATIYSKLADISQGIFWYNICNIVWMFPMFLYLQLFAYSCTLVEKAIEETQRIIKSCEAEQLPEKMIDKCFLNTIEADFSFTANGFFTIDISLIYNVFKAKENVTIKKQIH